MLEHIFPGKSELVQRMRELNWDRTPLGPVDRWPQSLRTSIRTCLACASPIIVWWGPDLAILYNDEFCSLFGLAKDPTSLGRCGAHGWGKAWDVMGPILAQVVERAEAACTQDLLLQVERDGCLREAYFSFSYNPIQDEKEKVVGVFCPVVETTEKVITGRRLRTLQALAESSQGAKNEASAYQAMAKALDDNPYDIPFALLYHVNADLSAAKLAATVGIKPGVAAAPSHLAFSANHPGLWSLGTVVHSGKALAIENLSSCFCDLPTGVWKVPACSALVLPILLPGQERPHTIVVAAISPMRALDEDYRTFLNLVATQIAWGLAQTQTPEIVHRAATSTTAAARSGGLERTWRSLISDAPIGAYLIGPDFRVREVNPIALPVFGDIPGGVVGRDFDEIIHIIWEKQYADEVVRIFRRTLQTGDPHETPECAELRIDRGIVEYYEWRLNRITLSDGTYGLVCYFRDISAQVGARKALEEGRKALKEADRRKDEFLATLAHELRNPLAPIRNSLHILRLTSSDSESTVRVREIMERQVNHMVRLVDDLMEVSRITRGKIELRKEQVELAAVVHSAVETSKPHIEAARHQLQISLPGESLLLYVDPVRLAQVLSNLLNNAAKYTPEGGTIWLTAKRLGTFVVVSIRDSGMGISAEMLPKVFDLFMQGERTYSRAQGGLGIGLTLVRSLVVMHGGSIEARSEGPGRGSEFVVQLPLCAEPGPDPKFCPHPSR